MNALRPLAASLLVLALLLSAGPSRADEASGHRPGLRDQWQAQTEHDARLAQPVRIEILGRAAVPALEVLSKETGVALRVAPEDLDTVGERKVTVIAQGCSLKSIMVQIPNALQECHWDADRSGVQPIYLLHRNAGAALTMTELAEEEMRGYADEGRPVREERVASARRALAMSPEEVAELSKTDPLLAAAVKNPDSHKQMELLLSLPPEAMEEFIAKGNVDLSFTAAPERFQQACRDVLQADLDFERTREEGGDQGMADDFAYALHTPDAVTFTYQSHDWAWGGSGSWLGVNIFLPDGGSIGFSSAGAVAIPPKAPRNSEWEIRSWRDLLVKTGVIPDAKQAEAVVTDLAAKADRAGQEARERTRALERREPQSPELHTVVTLPFKDAVDPVEVQRFVAHETGLSLVSDYFTTWGAQPIREEAKAALPVWELLSVLGETWFWTYTWDEVGDCLVFHDRHWYRAVPQEFPESMVLAYREKLKQQGRFTLDDVAAAAVEWERRRPTRPSLPRDFRQDVAMPSDLGEAGLTGDVIASELFLIYATLTPEQREQARTAAGVPYRELTAEQQALVRRGATSGEDKRPLPQDRIEQAVYRIEEGTETLNSVPKLRYRFRLDFPTRTVRVWLSLDPPQPVAHPATK